MNTNDHPYEPWTPKQGDRVRIALSSECRVRHAPSSGMLGTVTTVSWDAERWGPDMGYSPEDEAFDRASDDPPDDATVEDIKGYRFHWYYVAFDHPVTDTQTSWPIKEDLFAAVELEPLEEEA